MSWNGKDRRGLDRDWVERDRLLTETNTTVKSMDKIVKDYIIEDKEEHREIKKRVFFLTIAVVVIGVILGGPSFAMLFIK